MAKKSQSTIGEDPLDAIVPYDADLEDDETAGEDATEQPTPDSPQSDQAGASGEASGPPRPKSGSVKVRPAARAQERRSSAPASAAPRAKAPPAGQSVAAGTRRELQRINKELQVRVRELEFELAGGPEEDVGESGDAAGTSEDSSSIIAMVKDLHSEIDAAYELKEALETDLAATQKKLAEEESERTELDARVRLLEAKAALGDQLREDISFVEEERDETVRRLEAVSSELKQTVEERDSLAERTATAEVRLKEVQSDKIGLEAKVLNLEETVSDMDRFRKDLAAAREEAQRLEENEQNTRGKLEATEISKNALELDVTTTREIVRNQGEQIEELKDNVAATHAELTDLRAKLDRREIENANLREAAKRGERELKTLSTRNESLKKELDSSKRALRDIRAAAVRTTGRVRDRYSGS